MQDGFIKVSAVTPAVKTADVTFNKNAVIEALEKEYQAGSKIIVFPELCITGCSCMDLFMKESLIAAARDALNEIVEYTQGHDAIAAVGLPWEHKGKLYDTAAIIADGELLGLSARSYIDAVTGNGMYRQFTSAPEDTVYTDFFGESVPLGSSILYECANVPGLDIAVEISDEYTRLNAPSFFHAQAGASVILNPCGLLRKVGSDRLRKETVRSLSRRTHTAYIQALAGCGESTGDGVYGGENFICENGEIISRLDPSCPDENASGGVNVRRSIIDLGVLKAERLSDPDFAAESGDYETVTMALDIGKTDLAGRAFKADVFIPDPAYMDEDAEEIITIQALGLKKRLEHIHNERVVLGISGGLDSTLALLVCAKAMDMMGLPRTNIKGVTMPCFGTTGRTYGNACRLIELTGAEFVEINIADAVRGHLGDIGHDESVHNAAYENAQARERTQILMDIANDDNSIVVGTGDLSELALGWATYNGDHMSMYSVNASVPKTLMRHLIKHYAQGCGNEELKNVLIDVYETPVSPELLPADSEGKIAQKTEDLVGPYELHDFFLYYFMKYGYGPRKIFRLACAAFGEEYDSETVLKWLRTFTWRFFSQQFKRSCLPDGPAVGTVSISPRGGLAMPSDAVSAVWISELERIGIEG